MDKPLVRDYISSYLKKKIPEMVEREIKLENVSGKATVMVGPRRSGKTYLFWQEISKLNRNETVYLDFEDIALLGVKPEDVLYITKQLFTEVSGSTAKNVFLDEVQNVENWESLVRSLLDRGYSVYVTGSSSKLLSKEIATQLRGRSLTYLLLPFSFREFLRAKGFVKFDLNSFEDLGKLKGLLKEYLDYGGYPEIVLNPQLKEKMLSEYRDLIFFKDFAEREKVKSIDVAKFIFSYITQSFASEITFRSTLRSLSSAGIRFGKNTVYSYFKKLEETMVFFFLERYSVKVRIRAAWPKKVYLADNGLAFRIPYDMGRLMENAVFLELKRRQVERPLYEIFYYKDQMGHEVDFLTKVGTGVSELIQVTFASKRSEIKDREIKSLIYASKQLKCSNLLVLTWDYEGEESFNETIVKFVPLWKWLLNYQ
jgi:predicted AAA+ superfamily ATPase